MDNKENNQLEISLHYYLEDERLHQMDAFVRNKCEKHLLEALKQLFSFYRNYPIDVCVHKEGGLIDEYLPQIANLLTDEKTQEVLKILLSAYGGYYFNKMINRVTDIKNRLEILKLIKSQLKEGVLTERDAMILVSNDKKLKRIMENFFSTLNKEKRAISIGFTHRIPDQQPDYYLLDLKDSNQNYSDGSQKIVKYRVNNDVYRSMRAAVKRSFEIFIEQYPDMTAEDIINAWSALGIKVSNLIEDETTFHSRVARLKDTYSDEFTLKNGEHIYTTNHYSFERFCSFMEKVNEQDWGIRIDIM